MFIRKSLSGKNVYKNSREKICSFEKASLGRMYIKIQGMAIRFIVA
jgi:hypothetical protein